MAVIRSEFGIKYVVDMKKKLYICANSDDPEYRSVLASVLLQLLDPTLWRYTVREVERLEPEIIKFTVEKNWNKANDIT